MRKRTIVLAAITALTVAAGCGGSDGDPPVPRECNPLGGAGCLLRGNSKPAALRMVESFLLSPRQATDGCLVGGSPAPCDCATGACN